MTHRRDHLGVDHLQADLEGHAVRGGAASGTSQVVRAVLEVGTLMVLARLLVPAEFGLFAMVAALLGLANLSDLGLPTATVQHEDLTREQLSSLFWINSALGLALCALVAAAAPFIAWFYGEPRVMPIAVAMSTFFVIRGLGAQPEALLRRQLRFGTLAAVDIAATLAGAVAAVLLAWRGGGYWALVVQQLVPALFLGAGAWMACGWRPDAPSLGAGVSHLLSLGGSLAATRFLQSVTKNLGEVIVGSAAGATALGLYNNAYNLWFRPVQRLNAPVSQVAFPILSRLQEQPARFRSYYRRGNMIAASLTLPMLAFLLVDGKLAILTLLGEQWLEAVPIFRLLAVGAMARTLEASTSWVYQSLGTTQRQLRWGIVRLAVTAAGFAIGIRWGALGVAAGFSVAALVLFVPAISYCFAASPLRWSDMAASTWRPAMASALAGSMLLAVKAATSLSGPAVLLLAFDLAVFGTFYAAVWLIGTDSRRVVAEMVQLVRRAAPERQHEAKPH